MACDSLNISAVVIPDAIIPFRIQIQTYFTTLILRTSQINSAQIRGTGLAG